MMKYRYVIGIDTGVFTGFSIYDRIDKKLISVKTLMAHDVILHINTLHSGQELDNYLFRIEDARLRTWIPRQANEKAERGRAAGAGSVKRDAQILEDYLKEIGANYEMVAPKNNKTKWSADYFTKVTGWTNRCSQHARDSVGLCFGF